MIGPALDVEFRRVCLERWTRTTIEQLSAKTVTVFAFLLGALKHQLTSQPMNAKLLRCQNIQETSNLTIESQLKERFMHKNELERLLQQGRLFQVLGNLNSFVFAAQVPDESVGENYSRCSNCNNEIIHCEQICISCKLPFVGPSGFPQWSVWQKYQPEVKKGLAWKVFFFSSHGRISTDRAEHFPLTEEELLKIEELSFQDATLFTATHAVHPGEIRDILLS